MPKLLQTCPLRRATDGDIRNQWFPATDLASIKGIMHLQNKIVPSASRLVFGWPRLFRFPRNQNRNRRHNKTSDFGIDSIIVEKSIFAGSGIGIGIIKFWKMFKIRFRNPFQSRNHNPSSKHSDSSSTLWRALRLCCGRSLASTTSRWSPCSPETSARPRISSTATTSKYTFDALFRDGEVTFEKELSSSSSYFQMRN